jgi:hypothetical protein
VIRTPHDAAVGCPALQLNVESASCAVKDVLVQAQVVTAIFTGAGARIRESLDVDLPAAV